MNRTTFSVIVPCYNAESTLEGTLQSVRTQRHPDWECIVVNDGATDQSPEIAESQARRDSRFRVVHQQNRGLSGARNAGIRASSGDALVFLDSDDFLLPDALKAWDRAFRRNTNWDAIHAGYRYTLGDGSADSDDERFSGIGDLFDDFCRGNLFPVHAAAIRRHLIDHASFDETLASCEDWDFWLQISRAGCRWGHVADVLVSCRLRPGSMSRNARVMYENGCKVISRTAGDARHAPSKDDKRVAQEATLRASLARWATSSAALATIQGDLPSGLEWMLAGGVGDADIIDAASLVGLAISWCSRGLCILDGEPKTRILVPAIRLLYEFERVSGRDDLIPAFVERISTTEECGRSLLKKLGEKILARFSRRQ